jgi:hypothetical protein
MSEWQKWHLINFIIGTQFNMTCCDVVLLTLRYTVYTENDERAFNTTSS